MMFANSDNFKTVAQMQSKGADFFVGIPWDNHLALKYLDALPFPILMGLWVGLCGGQWTRFQIAIFLFLGLVLSGGLHFTYIDAGKKFPEVVTYFGKLPPMFWQHVIYMGFGFAIVGLGYFCSVHPAPWLVWGSTIYLIVHVTIGVHVLHKSVLHDSSFPYHGIMDAGTLIPIVGTAAALSAMTWWALR